MTYGVSLQSLESTTHFDCQFQILMLFTIRRLAHYSKEFDRSSTAHHRAQQHHARQYLESCYCLWMSPFVLSLRKPRSLVPAGCGSCKIVRPSRSIRHRRLRETSSRVVCILVLNFSLLVGGDHTGEDAGKNVRDVQRPVVMLHAEQGVAFHGPQRR